METKPWEVIPENFVKDIHGEISVKGICCNYGIAQSMFYQWNGSVFGRG
jgi:hypothetical protein